MVTEKRSYVDNKDVLIKQYTIRIRKHNEDLHKRGIHDRDLPEASTFMSNTLGTYSQPPPPVLLLCDCV